MYSEIQALTYRNNRFSSSTASLIQEVPLQIVIDDRTTITVMCTPVMTKELVAGFLFTEGFISRLADIRQCDLTTQKSKTEERIRAKITTVLKKSNTPGSKRVLASYTGTGMCGKINFDEFHKDLKKVRSKQRFSMKVLLALPNKLLDQQPLFIKTGGAHAAGLFDHPGNLLVAAEDMGRHNALDKVIGAALLQNIAFHDKILVSSGRSSLEMMLKTARAGIPLFIAMSRPSVRALQAADSYNITLLDLPRRGDNHVYTHARRIKELNRGSAG